MENKKTVIVTGGAKGIGLGIVKMFAENNYNVVVADLDFEMAEASAKEFGGLGVKCDVSNKAEVDEMVAKAVAQFGGVDVLVNNAGIYPNKKFEEMTEADYDKVMDVNVKGTILCSQAALKEMKTGSKIVNIASIASFVAFDGLAHYCASKGAILAMTRVMATELAAKKINVNAVAPGVIETPGTKGMDQATINALMPMIPAGRVGQPEDIAGAVLFLASDHADYVTGQTIIVDGGYTLH